MPRGFAGGYGIDSAVPIHSPVTQCPKEQILLLRVSHTYNLTVAKRKALRSQPGGMEIIWGWKWVVEAKGAVEGS